jgi:2-dehydropantoate 2-reductase
MMPHIAGLELESWSLANFGCSKTLSTSVTASRQAIRIASIHYGQQQPLIARIVQPWAMRAVLWFARKYSPLDLETYLAYHFTKVGDQTRVLIAEYIRHGTAADVAVGALLSLYERLIFHASGLETDK